MVNTPKSDFWQDVVLTPTGVLPGSYGPAQITVGADGRITNATNSVVSTISKVSLIAQLPTILGPLNGDVAVVLDDGSGNEEMYVWNSANADSGAPLNKWRRLSTTAAASSLRTDYRQSIIDTTAIQNIDSPVLNSGIVKSVSVEITVPYSIGTSIEIQNTAAFVFMPSSAINPLLAGIYKQDLSGNLTDMTTTGATQLTAVVGGGPGVGSGVVYVEWVDV
jgi:hypothetical protein